MSCGQKTRYDIERGNTNIQNSQYKTSYINEGYNYIRNQPKNVNAIILNRNPNIENYGYDYALYKGLNNMPPTEQEKREFEGVL